MKCPNCGGVNGKTNKYCRECGTRLDVLTAAQDAAETRPDEVGLGEELFSVIELFESGDLDSALEKGVRVAQANPGSASAHSIVALVYERKAEQELADGDPDRSHQFLKRAIDHYEELIDLNPDSAADREKLAFLRLKYTGGTSAPGAERFDLRRVMLAVPKPIWAAFGAFIVVLFLIVLLTPPSQPKPQPTAKVRQVDTLTVAVIPTEPADSGLRVYTFPQASSAAPPTPSKMPVPSVDVSNSRVNLPEVRPARLPKIDQELTLVAEPPKAAPKKPTAGPTKPADKPEPDKPAAASGGNLLAQAIRLHDQGKVSEAVGAANQAVVLYQADVDAGRNTEAASRGIKNAHKLITVWQQSVTDTSGM